MNPSNPQALMHSAFSPPYSPSSDSDGLPHPPAFSNDENIHQRRIGAFSYLSPPQAPQTIGDGLRYGTHPHTLQDTAQVLIDVLGCSYPWRITDGFSIADASFSTSTALTVPSFDATSIFSPTSPVTASPSSFASPTGGFSSNESSTGNVLAASTGLYSHAIGCSWSDNMSNYRSFRMPSISQASSITSSSLQSQQAALFPGTASVVRENSYPEGYPVSHTPYSTSSSGIGDTTHYSQYNTPRVLQSQPHGSPALYHHSNGMFIDFPPHSNQSQMDGPPFADTEVLQSITDGQKIMPDIDAEIQKGFFLVDDKWTCYRRNYFSVQCSFILRPSPHQNTQLFIDHPNQQPERIRSFAMSISAVVDSQEHEVRELVQHSPKRDKMSEKKPEKVTLAPKQPRYEMTATSLYHQSPLTSGGVPVNFHPHYPSTNQPPQPLDRHTFERIQFVKATANNGKRRAQQQYYNLVVELHAEVGSGKDLRWVKIARRLSYPMVVRGRSPGHYKDGRRDSSTSMGPDNGSGGGGGSGGSGASSGGRDHRSLSDMSHFHAQGYDNPHRDHPHFPIPPDQDHQYGQARAQMKLDSTNSSSPSPLMSDDSSSPFDYDAFDDSVVDGIELQNQGLSYDPMSLDPSCLVNRKDPTSSMRHSHSLSSNCDTKAAGSVDAYDESFPVVGLLVCENEPDSRYQFAKKPMKAHATHDVAMPTIDDAIPSYPADIIGRYRRYDPITNR